ncbi:MAG: orotidine-5'-phosphate decarboxylase [Archangium gephyra]|uniref:Orotidine 5'-phosphate decarboxylase n=1 Tax=Archangium gephyra TaxID=48 RepID=A0A2W5VNC2_9BACT|nr:MAG: orotidine-5'-phosphate decarboxylase [Archangium gephyra]
MAARDAIALAVDLPLPEGLAAWEQVAPHVGVAKVGLSLFVEHGPRAVDEFLRRGARVFLDLKLHDIPNTVELAAARAGSLGVSYLTIHASGGADMVKAAVAGATNGAAKNGHQPPIILAVTVLTSMNELALRETGVPAVPDAQAALLAELAVKNGAPGLVCSAREVASVRARVGAGIVLCTPGIRPVGAAANDQSRTETPASAIRAGADLLVVGRPITSASNMTAAAKAIEAEIRGEAQTR